MTPPPDATVRSHPRPDFRRADDRWRSLDGTWELTLDDTEWRPVVVPSPWESVLSGIGAHWAERGAYRRQLTLPPVDETDRLVVHFQAVHHRAEVLIDGVPAGVHTGGQTPFEIDVTHHAGRTVELRIEVDAPIDKARIPHGKQRSIPTDPYDVCSFTPCSGIWQSVWLERRPRTYLRSVRFVPAAGLDRFVVGAETAGVEDRMLTVSAEVVGTGERATFEAGGGADLVLEQPRLWSPKSPQLYEIDVRLHDGDRVLDEVRCTTGLRTIETVGAELRLNGERIHLRGVLDQGYWPDSGWTAPEDDALEADLLAARAAGFTLVRKHLKLEDPRWLAMADRLGMLVWEEPPSVSVFGEDSVAAFEAQLSPMIERDANHPSIVVWGIYNEEWGLDWDVAGDPGKAEALRRAYKQVTALDPSRPVVDNSGWSHVQTDLVDWHVYSPDQLTWQSALSGLAGGLDVELGPGGLQHKQLFADGTPAVGLPIMNSEYGTGVTSVERAWVMRWQTQELRRDDTSNGYVYCELYDIEHETAGVYTFARRAKDGGGLDPADAHADTVIVLDVVPVAPGVDLITVDGRVLVEARISSHAGSVRELSLVTGWGPLLGPDPGAPAGSPGPIGPVAPSGRTAVVQPFVLSAPVPLEEELPAGWTSGRLHVWAGTAGGRDTLAHTVLDVRRGPGGPSLH